MRSKNALSRAITIFGSGRALAVRLGISAPTLSQWLQGQRPVPPKRALQIEALTDGLISRKQLCPDWQDYWPDHNDSAPAAATDQPGTSPWHAKAAGASSAEDK